MHITGPTHIHAPHGINAPHAPFRGQTAEATPSTQSVDRLEISPAAEAAVQAAESGEIRHDLVNRIRSEIASGAYETPEKIDTALDRLLDEIG